MYDVSMDYLTAMARPVLYQQLRFEMDNWEYSDSYILKDTFTITNQCTPSSGVKLGAVYVGQMNCTFVNTFVERDKWIGLEIKVFSRLKVRNSTEIDAQNYDDVPIGVFTVAEARYTPIGVEVVAYDNMSKFDKEFNLITIMGTYSHLINYACNECNVECGMTEEEINSLLYDPTVIFPLYREHDLTTWREYIGALAAVSGAFATIDREGKLVFRNFGQNTAVTTLSKAARYKNDVNFSDYKTSYTAVLLTRETTQQTELFTRGKSTGLTIDLGANPFMQQITDLEMIVAGNWIVDKVLEIKYNPFQATVPMPIYDLGDRIRFSGGTAGTRSECCIMGFTYNYKKGFTMQGYGENPELQKSQSSTSRGASSFSSHDDIIYYAYTNPDDIALGSNTQVVDVMIGTTRSTTAVFQANIVIDVAYDFLCIVTYKIDGVEQDFHPAQSISTISSAAVGDTNKHTLSLVYAFPITGGIAHYFTVYLTASVADSIIKAGNVHAVISGQGLAAAQDWDGRIQVEDDIQAIDAEGFPGFVDFDATAGTNYLKMSVEPPEWEHIPGEEGYPSGLTWWLDTAYSLGLRDDEWWHNYYADWTVPPYGDPNRYYVYWFGGNRADSHYGGTKYSYWCSADRIQQIFDIFGNTVSMFITYLRNDNTGSPVDAFGYELSEPISKGECRYYRFAIEKDVFVESDHGAIISITNGFIRVTKVNSFDDIEVNF